MRLYINDIIINIIGILFLIIPIVLVTGPFLTNTINTLIPLLIVIFLILGREKKYFLNKFFIFFLFWSLFILVSSLLSNNVNLSLEASLFHFRFGLFFLGIYILLNKKIIFLNYFSFVLNFIFIFLIIDAIVQFFYGTNLFGFTNENENYRRLSGMFRDEHILGSFLARLLPLLIGINLFIYSHVKNMNYYNLAIILSVVIVTFITGERTAFFYVLFSLLLFITFVSSLRKELLIYSFLSILIILIFSSYNSGPKTRIIDETIRSMNLFKYDKEDSSKIISLNSFSLDDNDDSIIIFSKQHERHYKSAIKMFKKNIFFGVGPKNFRFECSKKEYFIENGCQTHPHNTYIQLLSETGIIGFLLVFFCLLFISIKLMLSLTKKNKFNEIEACILIGLLISLWPLAPSGSFFNNYIFSIYILPLGIYLHFLDKNYEK